MTDFNRAVPRRTILAVPGSSDRFIEKARTHLGYEPKVSLEEGLRRTLIWYGGNREAEEK